MRAFGGRKLAAADMYNTVSCLCALLFQFSDLESCGQLGNG